MEKHCAEWGALLLRLLVSAAPKVRNHAYDMAHKWAAAFAANKECMRAATLVLKEVCKARDLLRKLIAVRNESEG